VEEIVRNSKIIIKEEEEEREDGTKRKKGLLSYYDSIYRIDRTRCEHL
jgi:hypothetical protein